MTAQFGSVDCHTVLGKSHLMHCIDLPGGPLLMRFFETLEKQPCYIENHVVREPCKWRTACRTKFPSSWLVHTSATECQNETKCSSTIQGFIWLSNNQKLQRSCCTQYFLISKSQYFLSNLNSNCSNLLDMRNLLELNK